MSWLFHNPYYSARNIILQPSQPPLYDLQPHHPDNILQERKQIEDAIRLRQESMHRLRLLEYEESLRLKQRRGEMSQNKHDFLAKNEGVQTSRYYQQLEQKLKNKEKQREMLEERFLQNRIESSTIDFKQLDHVHSQIQDISKDRSKEFNQKYKRVRQDQFENSQIQSQRVIQQYQQQLIDKINAKTKLSKKSSKPNNRRNSISDRYQLDDVAGGENIIINKRTLQQNKDKDGQNQTRKTVTHKNSFTIPHQPTKKSIPANYQTINITETVKKNSKKHQVNLSQIEVPYAQQKYKTINTKNNNKTNYPRERKNSFYSERKDKKAKKGLEKGGNEKSSLELNNPLKRIQNRLKLSMIVFKDSQLKNGRYETNHLQNTYQTELRLRKDVKDRINNHPIVLEKHHLVVTSR